MANTATLQACKITYKDGTTRTVSGKYDLDDELEKDAYEADQKYIKEAQDGGLSIENQ